MSVKRAVTKVIAPWLNTKCTRLELQNHARVMGLSVSGTKSELVKALDDAIHDAVNQRFQFSSENPGSRTLRKDISVVSIDMGIRNLAFTHLTSSFKLEKFASEGTILQLTKPSLQAWRRISVGRENLNSPTDDADDGILKDASLPEDEEIQKVTKESFEPIDLAAHAYSCIKYIVDLQPTPTHILIERQRFRTGGHASVQEWSLRVGVFEGMLYSVLNTLKQEGHFSGLAQPVLPAQVNRFWLQMNSMHRKDLDGDVKTDDVEKITGKEAKRAKINLVAAMLQGADNGGKNGSTLNLTRPARGMVDAFMYAHAGRQSSPKVNGSMKTLKKLDDLADSLLQGLAWLRWQENRLKYTTLDSIPLSSDVT